jgi:hypothetical protein
MSTAPAPSSIPQEFALLLRCCEEVTDRRKARGKVHPLPSLLALAVLALMAGQPTLLECQRWAERHPEAWQALHLRRCPSVCTFWRLLQQVSVAEVQRVLATFAQQLGRLRGTADAVAALDGKTLCGVEEEGRPLRLLHVFAADSALLLDAERLPSHLDEAEVARAWVEALGNRCPGLRLLTGDAAFAEQSLCAAIVRSQRDYLVRVKKTSPASAPTSRSSSPTPPRPACARP